jgi:hypothetical protein
MTKQTIINAVAYQEKGKLWLRLETPTLHYNCIIKGNTFQELSEELFDEIVANVARMREDDLSKKVIKVFGR